METEALIVYIKFDGEQTIWDNMIDMEHPQYTILPNSISTLKDTINESFEWIVPLTFRCLYAVREFDLVGIFKNASDEETILNQINQMVSEQNISTLKINSCYGEVGYSSDLTEFKEIVHKMWGKAVYGAIKY